MVIDAKKLCHSSRNFDNSKKFTTENFARYVAPILRENFHAVEVHDTESFADEEFKRLDRENCIDGYFVTVDGTKEYFANRIQRGFYPSITVRKDRDTGNVAEFKKLCYLIERGDKYPKYFIHTYIKDSSSITAVVETKELIDFIKSVNPPVRHTRSEQIGQADFYVCDWQALKSFGANIRIFEKKNPSVASRRSKLSLKMKLPLTIACAIILSMIKIDSGESRRRFYITLTRSEIIHFRS